MLDFGFAPYAPPPCDCIEDITDAWLEETDPENERGEVCEARFIDSVTGHGCQCALIAITLTFQDASGANRKTSLPRELAIRFLTFTTVSRLERERAYRLEEE